MCRRSAGTLVLMLLPTITTGQNRPVVPLGLKRAVEIATSPEGSAQMQIAIEETRQAEARRGQARAALLPKIDGVVSQQSVTRNIAAFGVQGVPGSVFQPPKFVGPFTVTDIRASASQGIIDFASIWRYQASKAGVKAAESAEDSQRDKVAATTARAYLAALRSDADVETANANVELAQALLRQAGNLKAAGTGTGIDVTRARVQLANEQQRLLVARNDQRRTHLQLLRTMGVRLDTQVELTDRLEYNPVDAETLDKAAREALQQRADYRAQQDREQAAKLSLKATRGDNLPMLGAFGDYGAIGSGVDDALPTRSIGLQIRIPIFDGGRRNAISAESAAQFRQQQIRLRDLRDQIEMELELARDGLQSAKDEVEVSREGLRLAEEELAQARRRLDAGVANSLEVTEAQTRVARARENRTAALFHHAQARLDLAEASGTLRREVQ